MTLIELYDKHPINNIVGILALRPSKVIIVIPDGEAEDAVDSIRTVLDMKKLSVPLDIQRVDVSDVSAVRRAIETIAQAEPDCVLDLTGGDERLIAAAVSVAEEYCLQSQHIDFTTGTVTDTDGDGTLVPSRDASLTVREWITLHGGIVTGCTSSPSCTDTETATLWEMSRQRPREWNDHIKLLTTIEKGHHYDRTVSLHPGEIPSYAIKRFHNIRDQLCRHGIIQDDSTSRQIRYTYTKPYYRSFLQKAGNLLEHKAFYEAVSTVHNGRPLFNDVCMGVSIDWSERSQDTPKTTNNEIDVLLMCGVTPLFVSCKNGDVDENELYKLETVSTRFGGDVAKTMLIVTELEPDSPQARDALTQRAADMGIHLVANAGRLSPEEWKAEFLKAMGLG